MMNVDLIVVALLVLPIVGAIASFEVHEHWRRWAVVFVLALNAVLASILFATSLTGSYTVYPVGGWPAPYGIVLVVDALAALLVVTAAIVGLCSALYHALSPSVGPTRPLFQPLFLLLFTAINGVFVTGDMFNLYVFMELTILTSFALVALANLSISPEVTFKYAVISAIGSLLLLTGMALLYNAIGTLNLADVARVTQAEPAPPLVADAVALIAVAFLIKGAVFPFHFWQPDAHSAAPTQVSALLSGVLVKVGAYGLIRLSMLAFPEPRLRDLIVALGVLSMLYGAVAALATPGIKRLLAYSTISNMGFILIGIGWAGAAGLSAAIILTVSHALTKGGLFLTVGQITDRLHTQDLRRLGGLARATPWGAVSFGLGAVALAGLPPSSGFVGKLALFSAGVAVNARAILVLIVIASALALAYGLRAFVGAYWGAGAGQHGVGRRTTVTEVVARMERGSWPSIVPGLVLAGLAIAIGIWPAPLLAAVQLITQQLATPEPYIRAVLGGAA